MSLPPINALLDITWHNLRFSTRHWHNDLQNIWAELWHVSESLKLRSTVNVFLVFVVQVSTNLHLTLIYIFCFLIHSRDTSDMTRHVCWTPNPENNHDDQYIPITWPSVCPPPDHTWWLPSPPHPRLSSFFPILPSHHPPCCAWCPSGSAHPAAHVSSTWARPLGTRWWTCCKHARLRTRFWRWWVDTRPSCRWAMWAVPWVSSGSSRRTGLSLCVLWIKCEDTPSSWRFAY